MKKIKIWQLKHIREIFYFCETKSSRLYDDFFVILHLKNI